MPWGSNWLIPRFNKSSSAAGRTDQWYIYTYIRRFDFYYKSSSSTRSTDQWYIYTYISRFDFYYKSPCSAGSTDQWYIYTYIRRFEFYYKSSSATVSHHHPLISASCNWWWLIVEVEKRKMYNAIFWGDWEKVWSKVSGLRFLHLLRIWLGVLQQFRKLFRACRTLYGKC